MNIQTYYPVFENGQVLTSDRLNDIIDYLEPQDRLTRAGLTGIGVVCGLEPDWQAAKGILRLTRGVAVTSDGYLMVEESAAFDRYRPYEVPMPSGLGTTSAQKARARYPFLFDGESQHPAFELLPTDYRPAPGEAVPVKLSGQFVADKCVMLFLEASVESLKNCDVNDCSDKGSMMNLTLRRLLVPRSVADAMLRKEEEIARRPVDRARHPRLQLEPVAMRKLNPAAAGMDKLGELYQGLLLAATDAAGRLLPALDAAWAAYQPLLADMYPAQDFPAGPVPEHHLINMTAALAETPVLAQYFYAGIRDMQASFNEFLDCAARFDAECAPDTERFPRHVLLGDVAARAVAFGGAPATPAEYAAYDPLKASGGPVPAGAPAPRRHHFVPSAAAGAASDKAAELRALFARTVLLAQTYATRGLLGASLQLTPSRDGAAPLGARAIPFYYKFDRGSDLYGNWSWPQARANRYGDIFSHGFTATARAHPLLFRRDEQDFIRVEGVVGKPLGTTMQALLESRRALGLSFSVVPVWIGVGEDAKATAAAQALALRAMRQLLLCRLRDLDVIFLAAMAELFALVVWLVRLLGRLDVSRSSKQLAMTSAMAERSAAAPAAEAQPVASYTLLNFSVREDQQLMMMSDTMLGEARSARTLGDDAVKKLVDQQADEPLQGHAVASIYQEVRNPAIGGELYERVRVVTDKLGIAGNRDEVASDVYRAVALMRHAEEMMQLAGTASLAEFDEVRFATALRGFAEAYEAYAARADTRSGSDAAAVNSAILARREVVRALAAQFSSGAFAGELRKRVRAMFDDLSFAGFAQKHPGLEHKGGVPVGGTLVLLYASRAELQVGLQPVLDQVGRLFGGSAAKSLGIEPPRFASADSVKQLLAAGKPVSADVLDEFVVVGDFCLPHACGCDDCGEAVIARRIGRGEGVVLATEPAVPKPAPAPAPPAPKPPPAPAPEPEPAPQPIPRPEPRPEPDPGPVVRPRPERRIPTPQFEPRPTTGKVQVSVSVSRRGEETPAPKSTLTVTEAATAKTVLTKQLTSAGTTLELNAGTYTMFAAVSNRRSNTAKIAVKAGATVAADLVIMLLR